MWDVFTTSTRASCFYMKIGLDVTLEDDRDERPPGRFWKARDPHSVVLQCRTGALSLVRIPFEPIE
jgi:hypothetical protein